MWVGRRFFCRVTHTARTFGASTDDLLHAHHHHLGIGIADLGVFSCSSHSTTFGHIGALTQALTAHTANHLKHPSSSARITAAGFLPASGL